MRIVAIIFFKFFFRTSSSQNPQNSKFFTNGFYNVGRITVLKSSMSGTFVDRIDPFARRSMKRKSKKSQGSSRYRHGHDTELQLLTPLKGTSSTVF